MNIQTPSRHTLSRRRALKGVGATVALPFLEAMALPGSKVSGIAGDSPPVRLACLFMPNGVRQDRWTPEGTGSKFELSPILKPLQPFRDDIVVLSNLEHKASRPGDGHYVKCSGWLTGTTITKTIGKDINANGVSMDQIVAAEIGAQTKLASLELGTEHPMSGVDTNVNYTTLYANHIAWKSPTSPLPCELSPRAAFDRLFRNQSSGGAKSIENKRSVLDLVLDDAKALHKKISRDDQRKLDEYLDSVRTIEKRIASEEKSLGSGDNIDAGVFKAMRALDTRITKATGAAPGELGAAPRINPTEHVRLMMELMALAFWSDTTRVSTFMFAHAVSGRNFSFLDGVQGAHHEISHHKNDPGQLDQYQRINTWHTAQFAWFVERLKSIPEGSGTLLDNSMLLFGSGLRDGNSHNPHNLPLVLAGKAGGRIRSGRHLSYDPGTPMANLFVSMHQFTGMDVNSFADSTGKLKHLS